MNALTAPCFLSAMQEMAGTFEYTLKGDEDSDQIDTIACKVNENENDEEQVTPAKRRTIYKPISAFDQPKWSKKTDREKQHAFEIAPVADALLEKQSELFKQLTKHSPLDFFERFFDDEMFIFILDETHRYAQQNNSSFVLDRE